MGVLNATPDSFSDGGRFASVEDAVTHGCRMAEAGADILDVGGESTRPGAAPVGPTEEAARVVPVVEAIAARVDVLISVDTTKAVVAREALDAGASMVNDISALTFDPEMADVVSMAGAGLCVMHMRGTPRTMQHEPHYHDVVSEVGEFLAAAVRRAESAGVATRAILVDPGIGFGKTLAHNLALVRAGATLRERVGRPVLVGPSRKSFLGALTGRPVGERLHATAAAVAACVMHGAQVVRVHDVAMTCDVVKVLDAVRER